MSANREQIYVTKSVSIIMVPTHVDAIKASDYIAMDRHAMVTNIVSSFTN